MPIYIDRRALYECFIKHPSVCTDSRKLKEGDIFVALQGPSFDGNDFALRALEQGASYAVVSRPSLAKEDSRCLLVEDTLVALQDLARTHRASLDIPVVAITGTNGKTTTKELVHAVLGCKYHVLATEGNLNNHIGVPLTILRITSEHEVAVIEMGASGEGEISLLADIGMPTMGLITNIGKAHLEGFGSQEGVLRAKGELFEYLQEHGGCYLLNGDDKLLRERWYRSEVLTYGIDVIPEHHHLVEGECLKLSQPYLSMAIRAQGHEVNIHSHLIGNYNASNLLAAVAVGIKLGVSLEEAAKAIESYIPSNNRSQLVKMERGINIILDCYNANPSSMHAALENINASKAPYKLVVLGDMLELGQDSLEEHKRVIEWLTARTNVMPILVGREFAKALEVVSKGEAVEYVKHFDNVDGLEEYLTSIVIPDETIVLIKGSRGIALEKCEPLIEKASSKKGGTFASANN